jgi:hypothetical protein
MITDGGTIGKSQAQDEFIPPILLSAAICLKEQTPPWQSVTCQVLPDFIRSAATRLHWILYNALLYNRLLLRNNHFA